MTVITTINSTDALETTSRVNINNNFASLNANKLEASLNLSDIGTKNTALNNLLPTQTANTGKVLITDGASTYWGSPTGVAPMTPAVQGIALLSTPAVTPATPIVVGDNDVRVSPVSLATVTANQVAALAGTGTPSGAAKYVTSDTAAGYEVLTNKSTTTTLGSSDTLYPSQKAVKTYVDNSIGGQTVTAGAIVRASYSTSISLPVTTYTKKFECQVPFTGTLRIIFTLTAGVPTTNAYAKIYRNAVAVGTERHLTDSSSSSYSEDIAGWTAGDYVQIYGYYTGNSGTISLISICAAENPRNPVITLPLNP